MNFVKKNKKISFIISIFIILLFLAFVFLVMSLTNKVKKNITIEAGTAVPDVEVFFTSPEIKGKFLTDVSAIDTSKIGKISIELEIDGKKFTSFLNIEDTTPPAGIPEIQYIFRGNELEASDLVNDIEDATQVTCSFASPPDLNILGWQDATVILTDEGGNTANVTSKFYVFDIVDELVIEAGTVTTLAAEDFISNYVEVDGLSLESEFDESYSARIGTYSVSLMVWRYNIEVAVKVVDTVPPKGAGVEQYIFAGNELSADDLVSDIEDATQVTCSFTSLPDTSKPGWQDVTVTLTDEGGNTANVTSKFYVFDVADELVIEAGTVTAIAAEDFISNYVDIDGLSLESEFDESSNARIGTYSVSLEVGRYNIGVAVKVVDTVPPKGTGVEQYIFMGNELSASNLVSDIEDATQVTCSFASPPDLNILGWQDATVILTDEGGNTANVTSRFYVFNTVDELVIEAGTVRAITVKDFIRNYTESKGLSLTQNGELKLSVPASYSVTLKSGKYTFPAVVKVVDTTPPTADITNRWTYKNKPITADKFAYNIKDVSPVTVKYKTQPDFSVQGNQTVYIILQDAYQNTSEYKAELTVVVDTTPPVISGEVDKWVVVGGSISYRTGITVTDDYDSNVSLVIDSGSVNLNKAGTYTVIYSATDESGNKAEVKGTVTVRPVDMALVNEMADNILSKIVNNSMSQYNKAKAIYDWVHGKMKYAANSSAREIAQRAYDCFTKGSGDCYTYMAAAQVLLTRAGIQNVTVRRSGATTDHFWNLVNTGSGWYHFDVCPTPGNAVGISQRFMFTESQAQQYTAAIRTSYLYYQYDKTTVPEVIE